MTELTFPQLNVEQTLTRRRIVERGAQRSFPDFDLQEMLARNANLPEQTALLGLVDEHTPVLFDLNDPRPESLLLVNDHLPSLRRLMMVMARSLMMKNAPTEFQYIVVSDYPDKWMDLIAAHDANFDYCAGTVGGYENAAEDWILFLAQKAEARLHGRQTGASVILFMDDLGQMEKMDMDVRLNYEWLIRNGAQVNIWSVGGQDMQNQEAFRNTGMQFKTRIIGQMDTSGLQDFRHVIPTDVAGSLQPNRHFASKINQKWIRFWAPKLHSS